MATSLASAAAVTAVASVSGARVGQHGADQRAGCLAAQGTQPGGGGKRPSGAKSARRGVQRRSCIHATSSIQALGPPLHSAPPPGAAPRARMQQRAAAARLPVRCERRVRTLAVADATAQSAAQKRWESQVGSCSGAFLLCVQPWQCCVLFVATGRRRKSAARCCAARGPGLWLHLELAVLLQRAFCAAQTDEQCAL